VGVWDAVVHSRRAADTLHFPLNRPDMRLETAAEVVKSRFTSSTPLEQQVRVASFLRSLRCWILPFPGSNRFTDPINKNGSGTDLTVMVSHAKLVNLSIKFTCHDHEGL
jgi:hypothetical protein